MAHIALKASSPQRGSSCLCKLLLMAPRQLSPSVQDTDGLTLGLELVLDEMGFRISGLY